MLSQWLWIMVCYAERVVVNHGVLWWASGCKSCRVRLSQWLWLWIMLCYAEPVVVNHIVLCWASGCEPCLCYVEWVGVNHGVLCWASGCESWCEILTQWLWIMVYYAEPVVMHYGVLCWASGGESWCIAHHDSQPLYQHSTPWFTITSSA
jgi:hypothetical protein